ncbi:MAG: hypothetical protein V3R23_08200, partial [Nitrospinaceae bacterium]
SAGAEIKELALLETEEGKIFYEIEFEKDGKEHKIKIAEDGTVNHDYVVQKRVKHDIINKISH